MNFTLLHLLLLFSPLISAIIAGFVLRELKKFAVFCSIAACAVSFVCAFLIFTKMEGAFSYALPWIQIAGLDMPISLMNDALARMMIFMVTGVGLLIHIFSYGYMKEDPGLGRFFAKLSLFMFSMLGIVLAGNLTTMFIFWELVGLSSYLLIGFWFERPSAAAAAKKAFLVNRIGDFGFMIGILMVWQMWGSLNFIELKAIVSSHTVLYTTTAATIAALGLFCGCVGKSAQFPLHVWLPDAMEGPTPVSALIHAATMVAAGVYMLCRVFFLLELSPEALSVIAWTGAITALMAALIAVQQDDIKRILAYSTLSQLGYMVMAVGLGAWSAAMFHLTTHAFFKALLFLGSGSVIHSLHHEQNIWRMGGLWRSMRLTSWTFFIGTAALIGVPFLSGFFSKEAILTDAFEHQRTCFILGVLTATLTAFYMTRLLCVAFFWKGRSESANHVHESPLVMTGPLMILAALSIIAGYWPMEAYLGHPPEHGSHTVLIASFIALAVGVTFSFFLYRNVSRDPLSISLLAGKFYFDELYEATFLRIQKIVASVMAWVDRWLLEGLLIRGSSVGVVVTGEILRLIQGGNVRTYIIVFILGILAIFYQIFIFS